MTQKLESVGSERKSSEYMWDDGSEHDDVTKIYVRGGTKGIEFLKFGYVKAGKLLDGSFHGYSDTGFTQMFEIDHRKNEHLLSVEGYFDYYNDIMYAIQFKTNLKISEIMGYEYSGHKFTLAMEGKKIIGFHGFADVNLRALGAYVTWITPARMEAKGGKGGNEWDDGGDYEAVTKIHGRSDHKGIKDIIFDYVDKDGHPKSETHGPTSGQGYVLEPFEINHLEKEYLMSIDGYYDDASGVIQALQFKTNMKTSELMGYYDDDAVKFTIGCTGNKIIGFHGHAGKNLYSLGAYFTTLPLTKLEYEDSFREKLPKNGGSGNLWDDGSFQGVRKVHIYYDGYSVRCVRFDYDNDGKVESREHGPKIVAAVQEGEFVLDYPNEVITSVEGIATVVNTALSFSTGNVMIKSLTFKTSKGRTSPTFGNVFGNYLSEFKLESQGCAIVGFHGRSSYNSIHGLGAYFFPMPPSHDGKALEEQGGDGGLGGV
ncbi:Jacalin-related lectin 13 [Arabidopsis thaliana]|uniref:Jacalin-type lectin domain-containing protein n=2 Tax=Arabidopsis TaxID=3701 RepID=A0A178WDR5_ARATH|nr:Jacalin-like lectin domain [Arabidopsis thaliana x Arabidopsis arenosa]OAP15182.1 hypothetical protein AXX17_AT1G46390 [Arabidopsis thaliana]